MQYLRKGQFYGQTHETLPLEGLVLTDTEYTLPKVDWHYHEHPYFTFLLQGHLIEGNKKEVYHCAAGSLLFHNWQEPHYNIKPDGFSRGFHIELETSWMNEVSIDLSRLQGSLRIEDPSAKLLMYTIVKESKYRGPERALAIQSLLVQLLEQLQAKQEGTLYKNPAWVKTIRELLHDRCAEPLTLAGISRELGIHPAHLSRDFPRYFHCNPGVYLRRLKVSRSLGLLSDGKQSLSSIAYACGFADQSHFYRCFKEQMGIGPYQYRRLLFR
ncbi:MAG TPA: AraC family transcriptional regulator [Flavisolibacter sp.]|jgi:AraC-like DNA-binding protein|nr:AraC family transcriptional regulator [Flavisolibacter sp.]